MGYPGFGRPFSLGDALAAMGHARPRGLVPRDAWAALERAGRSLPAIWQWGMIECRLRGARTFDLLACAAAEPEDRGALLDGAGARVPPALRRWAQSASLREVRQVWLEWDGGRLEDPPLVWMGVDPGFYDPSRTVPVDEQVALILDALAVPGAEGRMLEASLRRMATALDGRGRFLGAGSLAPRGRHAWRVFVRIRRGELRDVLSTLGWPGDVRQARRWWDEAIPPLEPGFLQFELEPGIRPYLGIEARQTRRGFSNRQARQEWLAALTRAGLATSGACRASLDWNGESMADTEAWLRTFHVKLALDRGPEQAKAYLGFGRVEAA